MIPEFPEFKHLEFSDRDLIRGFSVGRKPYSDFNFTNLWSWNTLETRQISTLNNNLVVLFSDYKTNEMFLSFIGENHPNETAYALLTQQSKGDGVLKLIPKETANLLDANKFIVKEDSDNHDYIFSINNLSKLMGGDFKSKRRAVQKFLNLNLSITYNCIDRFEKLNISEFYELMETWSKNKQEAGKEHQVVLETLALNRLLRTANDHNLIISILKNNGKLIGFGIDEILEDKQAISHFIKADTSYPGVYEYMNKKIAECLLKNGAQFWNWEQNLGIDGLRKIKESYRPVEMLKKYRVSLK